MSYTNNNLANATALTGSSGSITPFHYDGIGDPATSESGEDVYGAGQTLWWKWTAPSSGDFAFDLLGSPTDGGASNGLDTKMQVFSGPSSSPTHAGLTWIDSNDDNPHGDTYRYNSKITFTATSGTTYYIQVDMYGSGQTGTLHLNWAPPPPPTPTATAWSEAPGRAFHTVFPGDDITVTGTLLNTADTVTVGGFAQTFTIIDSSHLTVHVGPTARSGPITVTNSGGSDDATGDARILFPGPWVQPPDATAVDHVDNGSYGYGQTVEAVAEPDFSGSPPTGSLGNYVEFIAVGFTPPPDEMWQWVAHATTVPLFGVTDEYRASVVMPPVDMRPIFDAAPDALDYELEAPAGSPLSDTVQVTFAIEGRHGNYIEDTLDRTADEDLWQLNFEFRRLARDDWYQDLQAQLTDEQWPSITELLAMPLDSSQPLLNPGATLSFFTNGTLPVSGDPPRPGAGLVAGPEGYQDPLTLPWSEYAAGVAWFALFDVFTTAAPIARPYMDPNVWYTGNGVHAKVAFANALVKAVFPYRPPRYRLLYTEPPVLPVDVTGWQVGSAAW